MMVNAPIEHLRKHLLENHDSDWRFEYVEYDGEAVNCYLPTDSPETYIVVDATLYNILETGLAVPQGLIDEITTVLADGLRIEVGWQLTDNPQKWA
tara:strand:+ start:401 stop:688 length:288 start_codon:yes stop_codon:yes gene_type:complete